MAPALCGLSVALALAGASVEITPAVSPPESHGSPRPAPVPGDQYEPHAATIGDTSMLVWTDERATQDIWSTRLRTDGSMPDGTGVRVGALGPVGPTGIASNGSVYWRVWMEGISPWYIVRGQFAGADGTPIGNVLQIGPRGKGTSPGVAWSGQEFVTVWADMSQPQLVGARTMLDGRVQTVSMSTPSAADSASVACGAGPVCLVVYLSPSPGPPANKDVRGRFFDPATLAFVTGEITLSSSLNDDMWPVVAYEPVHDAYVVAWRESASSYDVWVAALKSDSSVIGPFALEQTPRDETEPAVSCRQDGADLCAVAFRDDSSDEIHLWRMHGDLALIDSNPQSWPAAKSYAGNPTVSLSPGGGVLAWQGTSIDPVNGDEVYGVPLDGSGTALGPPVSLSRSANGQEVPAVAASGALSWLFWRDDGRQLNPGNYQVSLNDHQSWFVDDHNVTSDQGSYTLGTISPYGDQEALAVWADVGSNSNMGYAVIDALGGLQATGPAFPGKTGCMETTSVDFGGSVVVAARCANPALWVTAYQDGAFVPEVQISAQGSVISGLALGSDDAQLRLVWSDDRSGRPVVYGTRLDPDAGPVDGTGVPLSTPDGDQTRPTIAESGGTWLLAWQEENGDGGSRILGNRFGADWRPLDAQPLVLRQPDSRASAPRVLGIPGGFLLAGEEDANQGDLRAEVVDQGGMAGAPFDVSASPDWEGQVSLAMGRSETEVLAAYTALDPTVGVATRRVYTRWIDLTGGAVAVPDDDAGVIPHDPLGIGCDCSSAGGGALWLAVLLVVGAAARVRPGRSARRS